MSKPANSWYGIVIKTIRRYPELKKRKAQMHNSNIIANYSAMPKSNTSSRTTENIAIRELKPADERELQAVEKAIGVMYSLSEGKEIMKIVELVDFKHTHLLRGAAFECNISEQTAKRRRQVFVNECARQLGYL